MLHPGDPRWHGGHRFASGQSRPCPLPTQSPERGAGGVPRHQLRLAPPTTPELGTDGKWVDSGLPKASAPLLARGLRAPGGTYDPGGDEERKVGLKRGGERQRSVVRPCTRKPGSSCHFPDPRGSGRPWGRPLVVDVNGDASWLPLH